VEGVHNEVFNSMTLHTNPGCTLDTSRANVDVALPASANTFVGTVKTTDCDVQVNFNSGCSTQDTDGRSFGIGLNGQQGGVYATLWDDTGIKFCTSAHRFFVCVGMRALTYASCKGFFPRGFIPEDITNSTPDPSLWPAPKAFFAATTCPIDQFFKDHVFVINTTLCGDLGNPTYGPAGCPGTCAEQVANPANFNGILTWISS